jgi:hypothetical protein
MATLNVADLNRQGKVFVAANASAKTVSVVGTAMTGLILFNPIGSGKKAIIVDAGFVYTTAPVANTAVGLATVNQGSVALTGTGVSTLSSTQFAADSASGNGAVQVFDAATVLAVTAKRWIGQDLATGSTSNAVFYDRVDGSLVLAPGTLLAFCSLVTAAVGAAHITWAEVNV